MKNEDTENKIDRFITDEMSHDERKKFEAELEQDDKLKEEVCLTALIAEAEQVKQEKSIREELAGIPEEEIKQIISHSSRNNRTLIITLAITSCAAVIVAFFMLGDLYKYYPSEISGTYSPEAPVIEYSRGGKGLTEAEMQFNKKVISAYERRDYDQVIAIFGNAEKEFNQKASVQDDACQIALAFSWIQTGRFEKAIPILTQLSKSESDYSDDAEWLLLYAYLETNNRDKAIEKAQSIISKESIYKNAAGDILEKLNEKKGL